MIALAHVRHLLGHRVHGIANLVGFQCMIHSIVAAGVKPLCEEHGNLPLLTLLYDFQKPVHHSNRIEAFMHQVRQYQTHRSNTPGTGWGQPGHRLPLAPSHDQDRVEPRDAARAS